MPGSRERIQAGNLAASELTYSSAGKPAQSLPIRSRL